MFANFKFTITRKMTQEYLPFNCLTKLLVLKAAVKARVKHSHTRVLESGRGLEKGNEESGTWSLVLKRLDVEFLLTEMLPNTS